MHVLLTELVQHLILAWPSPWKTKWQPLPQN